MDPKDIEAAARRAGAHDPTDAAKLIDQAADETPDAAVARLKAAKPHLFAKRATDMSAEEWRATLDQMRFNQYRLAPKRELPPAASLSEAEWKAELRRINMGR